MGVEDPKPQGWANEPAAKKKNLPWTWVLVASLVLCLVLVAGGLGVYLVVTRSENASPVSNLPAEEVPLPQTPPIAPADGPELPTEIVIEPYGPGSDDAILLTDLVPGYHGSLVPGDMRWDVLIGSRQPAVIQRMWCAATEAILEENFFHIEIHFEADGEEVDMDNIYLEDYISEDMFCRVYLGIIQSWPIGRHNIITHMRIDALINNGWNDYPAGRYLDLFLIDVIP